MKDRLDEFSDTTKSAADTVKEETQAQWNEKNIDPKMKTDTNYRKSNTVQKFYDDYFFDEFHSQR